MRHLATSAALCALMTNAAIAQDTPVDLGTLVLSAGRTGAPQSAIPGATQVIDSDMLEKRLAGAGGGSLEQVLADLVPGYAPSNGGLSTASQTLRGRKPQILIDGVSRTSELRASSRELNMIDPASIERIEIIKGSTARYGNGATGGIINIVTKRPTGDKRTTVKTGLSFQEGSDSLGYDAALAHERRIGDLGLRFELSGREMNNRYDGAGRLMPSDPLQGQGSADNFDQYSLGLAAGYALGNNSFAARVDTYRFEQDIDVFADYGTDPVTNSALPYTGQPVLDEGTSASLTWKNDQFAIGEVEVNLYASDLTRRSAFVPGSSANPLYYTIGPGSVVQDPNSQGELSTQRFGAQVTVRSDLSQLATGAMLTWGMDVGYDEVRQKGTNGRDLLAPMEQNSIAVFGQLDVPLGESVDLSAGLRAERFDLTTEDFIRPEAALVSGSSVFPLPAATFEGGSADYDAVVGNIGAVWHVRPDLDLFAGFSQGFSVPDVGAFTRRACLFSFPPCTSTSFDAVKPDAQIVDTYELGARLYGEALRFETSAFFSTSDEGSQFDPATSELKQEKEEIWGAEIDLGYAVADNWNLGLLAAYTDGKFDDDGDGSVETWLKNNRIPSEFTGTLYTDYSFANGLDLGGELVYASGRYNSDQPDIDENIRVNVYGSYPVGLGQLRFGVANLFDRTQENPTASSVRETIAPRDAIRIADEGRRFSIAYEMSF